MGASVEKTVESDSRGVPVCQHVRCRHGPGRTACGADARKSHGLYQVIAYNINTYELVVEYAKEPRLPV